MKLNDPLAKQQTTIDNDIHAPFTHTHTEQTPSFILTGNGDRGQFIVLQVAMEEGIPIRTTYMHKY